MSQGNRGDRPRGCLSMGMIVIILATVIPPILVLLLITHCLNWFAPRDVPAPGPTDQRWAGGNIVCTDRSTFPGGYDFEFWWFGPRGERVLLLDLGDNKRFTFEVKNGRFEVRYLSHVGVMAEKDRWTEMSFLQPGQPPNSREIPDPNFTPSEP